MKNLTIKIEKCTSPEAWYRNKVGQTFRAEGYEVRRHASPGITEDVWWCREGGVYNCLNYVMASDATVILNVEPHSQKNPMKPELTSRELEIMQLQIAMTRTAERLINARLQVDNLNKKLAAQEAELRFQKMLQNFSVPVSKS